MQSMANNGFPQPKTSALVPIDSIKIGVSPRLSGENAEHARALAETESSLPPILVHRQTMRVIDGVHRLLAAELKGRDQIEVWFFDGDDHDAFVAAVKANIVHGLPLSLADREAAAARIARSHPQWSDRAIAEVTGLAANTVARIRSHSTGQASQLDARVGRDGRLRPLSSAAGRRVASKIIADRPNTSLREVAKESGISLATARDVRERLRRGDDPVPVKEARAEQKNSGVRSGKVRAQLPATYKEQDRGISLKKLQRDPSLRLSENGRRLLRWLAARSINPEDWGGLEEKIPKHCISLVVDVARENAEGWRAFAEALRAVASEQEK